MLNLRYSYMVTSDLAKKLKIEFEGDESFEMRQKGVDSVLVYLDSDYVKNSQLNIKRHVEDFRFSVLSKDIASKKGNWDISNFGPIIMPPKKYFFLGDNRDNSLDSRYRGFVDEENIIGTLIYNF